MTLAQLQAAVKAAYDGVSNNATLDPAVARQTLANDIGAAVQAYVSANVADPNNLIIVRDGIVDLIGELRKLKVDIGNNLSSAELAAIETALEAF